MGYLNKNSFLNTEGMANHYSAQWMRTYKARHGERAPVELQEKFHKAAQSIVDEAADILYRKFEELTEGE